MASNGGWEMVNGGVSGSLVRAAQRLVSFALAGYQVALLGCRGLTGALAQMYAVTPDSVVADFGSGNGVQLLSLASFLRVRLCIGLEVSLSHLMAADSNISRAIAALRENGRELRSPIALAPVNIEQISDGLAPVTHIFAYIGCVEMALALSRAVATSTTLKAVCVVILKASQLPYVLDAAQKIAGGYEPLTKSEAVIVLQSFKCPAGKSYNTFLIPVSPGRQLHTARRLLDARNHIKAQHQRLLPLPTTGAGLKVFV
jgi:hypothetical protein